MWVGSRRSSVTREHGGQYVVRFTDISGRTLEQRFDTKREAKWFCRGIREWPEDEPFDENAVELMVADYAGLFTRNIGRVSALARRVDASD